MSVNIIDISYTLSCQALDSLYYLISKDNQESSFAKKFSYVFKHVYKHDAPRDTANALRIIRNDVIHTGEIMGIDGSRKNTTDTSSLKQYLIQYDQSQQNTNDVQKVISIAGAFNYLMGDLVLRVLGLEWSDLSLNLNPPSCLNYFYAETSTS